MPLISVVSPVYKAEGIVPELVKRIKEALAEITENYEIILVNDGSPDNSWSEMVQEAKVEMRVKAINLSRNFGQHQAITAGLSKARGAYAVLMDCDLQDRPEDICMLLDKAREGFEVVFTKRKSRAHSRTKSSFSKMYNAILLWLTDGAFNIDTGSLLLMSQKVNQQFLKLQDQDRLYVQMIKWLGYSHTYVEVEHAASARDKTSYTFSKLVTLALKGAVAHSNKLLFLAIGMGVVFALISIISAISIVLAASVIQFDPGWPSLICAILFSTGVILISNGILGIYLSKTFEQVKARPFLLLTKC